MTTHSSDVRAIATDAKVLERSVAAVLEEMFFESLVAPPLRGCGLAADALHAEVSFWGTFEGLIRVALDPAAAQALALNFLPSEDGGAASEEGVRSVLCELANMICGSYVSAIAPAGDLRLRAPRIAEHTHACDGWIVFPLESGRAAVYVELEGARE